MSEKLKYVSLEYQDRLTKLAGLLVTEAHFKPGDLLETDPSLIRENDTVENPTLFD